MKSSFIQHQAAKLTLLILGLATLPHPSASAADFEIHNHTNYIVEMGVTRYQIEYFCIDQESQAEMMVTRSIGGKEIDSVPIQRFNAKESVSRKIYEESAKVAHTTDLEPECKVSLSAPNRTGWKEAYADLWLKPYVGGKVLEPSHLSVQWFTPHADFFSQDAPIPEGVNNPPKRPGTEPLLGDSAIELKDDLTLKVKFDDAWPPASFTLATEGKDNVWHLREVQAPKCGWCVIL